MHSYQHNIKTFNNATRHLTRVERSLYRDLIELYYDIEQPLPAVDFDRLARRVLANTEDEKAALQFVLDEFFILTGEVYTHTYCDEQIEKYHTSTSAKAAAGKASAQARKKKQEDRINKRKAQPQQKSTDAQQPLNECSTNKEPVTNNQEPSLKDIPPEENPPAETPKKPKRKTRLPDDFALTGHLRGLAIKHWAECNRLDLDADDVFAGFVAHHKSKGNTMLDWNAAWTTWYMNAPKFTPAPRGQTNASNHQSDKPRSVVDRIRAGNDQRSREREAALSGQWPDADPAGIALGADGGNLRPQVGERLRGGGEPGLGNVLDGDYTRDDQAGNGTHGR